MALSMPIARTAVAGMLSASTAKAALALPRKATEGVVQDQVQRLPAR